MDERDFKAGFPGTLEPTTFVERRADGHTRTESGIAFVPHPLPPSLDAERMVGRLHELLDQVRTNLTRLEGVIESLPGRTVLLSAMRVREAQASSKIESTFASIKDIALAAIDESRVPGDASEVRRNRQAIELGLESALPVSVRLLREMHKVLIRDPSKRPGEFRDLQVSIGDESRGFRGARFVPPPPQAVAGCLRDFELFCNPHAVNAPVRARLPYFVELALAHYQFETIHPFSDGNGRLGRALVTIAPVKDGQLRHPVCNLSEWVQANRQEYYDRLLRVSTHGEWEDWIRFFCRAVAEQAVADLNRARRLAELYDRYAKAITTKRSSILQTKLLDFIFDRQVLTVPLAADHMGVTYAAAQRHVEKFVKAGIIRPHKGWTYNKAYVAEGVIRAIRGQGED